MHTPARTAPGFSARTHSQDPAAPERLLSRHQDVQLCWTVGTHGDPRGSEGIVGLVARLAAGAKLVPALTA
jgi:hypothetical protein